VGSAKRDLLALPEDVVDVFGYALYLAQIGRKHEQAKPLKGLGSAGVLEVVEDWEGNISSGLHRAFYSGGVRAARVSEKVNARPRHSEA